MAISTESLDITLLRNNKNEFILHCQRVIEIVVKHFIKRGMFTHDQFNDVMQSTNEELIKRLPSIEKSFDNRVLLVTYMNVVIRNICLRIYEREKEEMTSVELLTEHLVEKEDHFTSLHIQDEVDRLTWIIQLYGRQQHKIIVCLKIYFNMPLTKKEILLCFDKSSQTEQSVLFDKFGRNYVGSLDSENFNSLAPLMNKQENNSTSGNSIRRWTQEQLTKIKTQLNGNPPSRTHTKETIKILLEHCTL